MPSHLLCEFGDGVLVVLPHLERGVLGALLVQGVHDVAVDVDGQALDRPLFPPHLSPYEVT